MSFIITNSIETNVGQSMSNTWGFAVFHTQEMLITGKVQVDLNIYKSEIDKDAGSDKIYPVENGAKITNCTIDIALADVVKASGQSTMADVVNFFYTKVKDKLESLYGWTITIE